MLYKLKTTEESSSFGLQIGESNAHKTWKKITEHVLKTIKENQRII